MHEMFDKKGSGKKIVSHHICVSDLLLKWKLETSTHARKREEERKGIMELKGGGQGEVFCSRQESQSQQKVISI